MYMGIIISRERKYIYFCHYTDAVFVFQITTQSWKEWFMARPRRPWPPSPFSPNTSITNTTFHPRSREVPLPLLLHPWGVQPWSPQWLSHCSLLQCYNSRFNHCHQTLVKTTFAKFGKSRLAKLTLLLFQTCPRLSIVRQ